MATGGEEHVGLQLARGEQLGRGDRVLVGHVLAVRRGGRERESAHRVPRCEEDPGLRRIAPDLRDACPVGLLPASQGASDVVERSDVGTRRGGVTTPGRAERAGKATEDDRHTAVTRLWGAERCGCSPVTELEREPGGHRRPVVLRHERVPGEHHAEDSPRATACLAAESRPRWR